MTQRERIAWYVLRGELIDSKSLYAAFKALSGKRIITGKAAKAEYYCSEKCLHQHYSEEEFLRMYDNGNSETYYTCWID